MNKALIAIDCEGPLTRNDNAFELCKEFIPDGEKFFTKLSILDDKLVEMGVNNFAGSTLKMITPFLKAYGVTNEQVACHAKKTVKLMEGAENFLRYAKGCGAAVVISTSYKYHVKAMLWKIGIEMPYYGTNLDLDSNLSYQTEKTEVRGIVSKIISGTLLEIYQLTKSLEKSYIGRLMVQTCPVGGEEKKRAVMAELSKTDMTPIYIGDSITDVIAMRAVKNMGGLAISINGNNHTVKAADVACITNDSSVLLSVCEAYIFKGKGGVEHLAQKYLTGMPIIRMVNPSNEKELIGLSLKQRELERGQAIAKLG